MFINFRKQDPTCVKTQGNMNCQKLSASKRHNMKDRGICTYNVVQRNIFHRMPRTQGNKYLHAMQSYMLHHVQKHKGNMNVQWDAEKHVPPCVIK